MASVFRFLCPDGCKPTKSKLIKEKKEPVKRIQELFFIVEDHMIETLPDTVELVAVIPNPEKQG